MEFRDVSDTDTNEQLHTKQIEGRGVTPSPPICGPASRHFMKIAYSYLITGLMVLMIGFVGCRGSSPEDSVDASSPSSTEGQLAALEGQPQESPESHEGHGPVVPVTDEKGTILYWTCVMHPTVRMAEVGTCPVCNMDLIPVYEGEGLTLTDAQKALIPIRTETIGYHKLEREIRTVGSLDYDETKVAYASTRISGWIQDLHVDFTGTHVKKGESLLEIYSPELLVAQEEYLLTLKNVSEIQGSHLETMRQTAELTVQAAESRLELLGVTKQQIEDIKDYGKPRTELPLYAPIGGTVIHMNIKEGQFVNKGMNLFRIADLSSLWLLADIYEYEMPWVQLGQRVTITVQSMPDKVFEGHVIFIYPYMDTKTRTVRLQVHVPNPEGQFRPGMYANVRLKSSLSDIYTEGENAKVEAVASGEGHDHGALAAVAGSTWTCPMHPQVVRDEAGECPICGMDLVEAESEGQEGKETGNAQAHERAQGLTRELANAQTRKLRQDAPSIQFKYICPDHPEQAYDAPGKCPEDGQPLMMTDEVLAVPKSAVIDTGLRAVVFVDKGDAAGYVQTEVKLGPEAWSQENGKRRYFPIVSGLFAGDVVVTNGNYLLDSQTQLTGSAAGAYGGALGGEDSGSSAPAHQH